MIITGIDPGPEKSAVVTLDNDRYVILYKEIISNQMLVDKIACCLFPPFDCKKVIIEKIASYGMPVGESVFQTVQWYGRFQQAFYENDYQNIQVEFITRNEIKNIICNSSRAKDSNIRQALIDRLGVQGTKKNQGRTYGVSKDLWAALAVAIAYSDKHKN